MIENRTYSNVLQRVRLPSGGQSSSLTITQQITQLQPQVLPNNVYSVREEAINEGLKYETTTAATLSLHYCKKEMWLARNVADIKKFDDIVLFYSSHDSKHVLSLIQVKYKRRKDPIENCDFIQKSKQFYLEAYVNDYNEIQNRMNSISGELNYLDKKLQEEQKNIKYVLHTNRTVKNCDFLEIVVDDEFDYGNFKGKLYKFIPEELKKYAYLKHIINPKFLKNLFLCAEDILFRDTEKILVGKLKNILEVGCQKIQLDEDMLTNSVTCYKGFFEKWETCQLNDNSAENYPLLRKHIITKITQILCDKFIFKFKSINSLELPNSLNIKLRDIIKNNKIVITDPNDKLYPYLKQYMITEVRYYRCDNNRVNISHMEDCKIYHEINDQSHSRWCMWMHGLLPLVLEIHRVEELEAIIKIIRLSDFLRFIVISHPKKHWSDLRDTVENNSNKSDNLFFYLPSSELLPEKCNLDQSQIKVLSTVNNNGISNEVVSLHQAIKDKEVDTVMNLLNKSNVNMKDEHGKTPLHYAAWTEQLELTKIIVDEFEAKLNQKDKSGKTPLHCAVDPGNSDIVKFILERGAIIDEIDNEERTPLFYAVNGRSKDIVELLFTRNANPDILDALKWTPLYLAIDRKFTEIVAVLLNKNASTEITYKGNTVLHCAVEKGSKEIVKQLLEKQIDVNAQNRIEQTALNLACKKLYDKNNSFSTEVDSNEVLQRAKNYKSIIEALLEKEATVDTPDYYKKTALNYAEEILKKISYMNRGNLDDNDEDDHNYTVNQSSILKCYEDIMFALTNRNG